MTWYFAASERLIILYISSSTIVGPNKSYHSMKQFIILPGKQ